MGVVFAASIFGGVIRAFLFPNSVGWPGFEFGVGILIAGVAAGIALRQSRIGTDTQLLLERNDREGRREDRIARFFQPPITPGATALPRLALVKYVTPAEFPRKPLPMVYAGDFFVVSVLTQLLRGHLVALLTHHHSGHSAFGAPIGINDEVVVYICSPEANPELNRLFPTFDHLASQVPPQGLPAWFSTRAGDHLQIVTATGSNVHSSPRADQVYDDIAMHMSRPIQPVGIVSDVGLVARIRMNNRTNIVIAGNHQYGTWIAGEALRRMLESGVHDSAFAEVLFSDADVLLVVEGEFDDAPMSVNGTISCVQSWSRGQGATSWSDLGFLRIPPTT